MIVRARRALAQQDSKKNLQPDLQSDPVAEVWTQPPLRAWTSGCYPSEPKTYPLAQAFPSAVNCGPMKTSPQVYKPTWFSPYKRPQTQTHSSVGMHRHDGEPPGRVAFLMCSAD